MHLVGFIVRSFEVLCVVRNMMKVMMILLLLNHLCLVEKFK